MFTEYIQSELDRKILTQYISVHGFVYDKRKNKTINIYFYTFILDKLMYYFDHIAILPFGYDIL